jgi:hypothetical protein
MIEPAPLAHGFGNDACDRVSTAARRIRHDQTDWMRRIIVCVRGSNGCSKCYNQCQGLPSGWHRHRLPSRLARRSAAGLRTIDHTVLLNRRAPKNHGIVVCEPADAPRVNNTRMTMLHKLGVTQSLAHFIAATRWDDIPPPVAHQAKRSFMNFSPWLAAAPVQSRSRCARSPNFPAASRRRWSVAANGSMP